MFACKIWCLIVSDIPCGPSSLFTFIVSAHTHSHTHTQAGQSFCMRAFVAHICTRIESPFRRPPLTLVYGQYCGTILGHGRQKKSGSKLTRTSIYNMVGSVRYRMNTRMNLRIYCLRLHRPFTLDIHIYSPVYMRPQDRFASEWRSIYFSIVINYPITYSTRKTVDSFILRRTQPAPPTMGLFNFVR